VAVKTDSNGNLELGAYAPLQIAGLHWCLITAIALDEVITPKLATEQIDFFTKYIGHQDYYDLLLIHASGKIFYSVKHQADYGTNILSGKYADSNLGKLVQSVLQNKTFAISDYGLYGPSNNLPAAFLAQPVLQGEQVELIVVLQLSDESLNKVMQQRAGLGESGETYLVGNDNLMRSNSFLGHDTHSMRVSFAHPENGIVDTESSRAALHGQIGEQIIENYQGDVVLSAYTPLKVGDNLWALLAEIHQTEAFAGINTLQQLLGLLALVVGVSVFFFLRRFVCRFMAPLSLVNEHLKVLAQGKLTDDDIHYQGRNEIAEIISSFKRLKTAIRSTMQQANAIAAGDYEVQVHLLSQEDQLGNALSEMVRTLRGVVKQAHAIASGNYTEEVKPWSDKDQLGMALSNMVKTLRDITTDNSNQDWLKSGQMQLSQEMSGKQDLVTLAKNIIRFLCNYLQAQVGVFYMVVEESSSDSQTRSVHLKLLASYAYTWRKNLSNRFEFGEGMVGQAALEQQAIIIMQVPAEAIYVQSGLMDTAPRQVIVIPFLYESVVKGVIELGFFQALTELQVEFLNQVMSNIAIAVNTAESRTQMQELLRQSQVQTEELHSQAEELQSQQEELRQTNEELEERTRELERQQRDIQDKNRGLEQSRQAMETKAKELELVNKYKSEFLANMSHELRTPLNSLLILAQLLAENKPGNLNDKQVEYARTIHSAGNDLLVLINDILDLSKVEAGKLEVHPEEFSLKDMVETIDLKFRHIAEQKGFAFKITVAEELLPVVLYTDAQRLKQIINNLLSNAFKFTTRGEVSFVARRPASRQELSGLELEPKNTIAIRVTDTGIGIPKDKQDLVFEAFRQADGTTSRRFGGTGLGLSISRQLARLLGGDIHLESGEGQGSTFSLYIPEALANKPKTAKAVPAKVSSPVSIPVSIPLPAKASSPEADDVGLEALAGDDRSLLQPGDKTILIIDDDRKFSSILMELTHEKNFKCLVAEDGKTGLQLAEQYLPSAIILDIGLPQMDGWTVMERLKDSPTTRHIPVHFVSASSQKNMEAKRMGAIGYLFKPVNMAELSEAFQKIEQFIAKTMKNLLVIVDNERRQRSILDLVGSKDIQFTLSVTKEEALQQLRQAQFDCIILDIDVGNNSGLNLLEQLYQEENLSQIPVIIYAERELTTQEEVLLQQCEENLTVKTVRSPERLLDEATLFLHQLEANLPKEKRTMLRRLHDKQAILADKKVLVVDDDMRNTFALTTILEDKEMQVIIAENGQEALELLSTQQDIDMVLMDIMMPEMDGYETIRKIRTQQRFRKLPIIALTAKAMKGDKTKCLEAGANDYLAKPIDADKLISLMRVWLYR
jgi:signal transduction histidine kinase/CheY-like chemotaxis protein